MEKLSIALILKNEEKRIRKCLESLAWADEIVILDGYSTDKTLEIAGEFTDKIYQKEFTSFPQERQYLLTKTSNSWVFMVDGDMLIPDELKEEIIERFKQPLDEYSAFNLRFLNIYLGKKIRHCGWYDPDNTRIFNKHKGGYDTRLRYLDTFTPSEGRIGVLKNHILHFGFETISEHFVRMDRYAALNAYDLKIKGCRITGINMPYFFIIKPMVVFLYKYVYKKGFLDGAAGLILCVMSAFSYCTSYFRLWEMQKKNEPKNCF